MSERLKPNMTEMMNRVAQQTEKKELWVENDAPDLVAEMIVEEAQELVTAVQEALLSGDVFSVASEIGDVLYLALKFCHQLGLVPEDTVKLKLLRNDMKYPSDLNSNGDYAEQRRQSKDMWTAMGGDESFSHAYLEMFADMEEVPEANQFALALGQSGSGHHPGEALN